MRITIKKTASLFLILILSLTMITACGSSASTSVSATASISKQETTESKTASSSVSSTQTSSDTDTTEPAKTVIPLKDSEEADCLRAFSCGYIDKEWENRDREETIHTTEYKALLTALIARVVPEKLEFFNSKVTDFDAEMNRGMAAVMSWYAALCLGIDDYNNGFEMGKSGSDDRFWEIDGGIYNALYPDCLKETKVIAGHSVWDSEFVASMIWNTMRSSPVSDKQTIDWEDDIDSLRAYDPFTAEDAVCAITRLNDNYLDTVLLPIDSEEAKGNTIDAAILQKAAQSTITSIDELPRLTGFIFAFTYDYESQGIVATARDIKNMADWGFTSARVPVKYEILFSEDCTEVRPMELERLDDLVAASVEYGVHLNLSLTTLPGRTVWLDVDREGAGDFDMFTNKAKQKEAIRIWQYLAERYKDIPGEYLSFMPFWEANNKNLATGAPGAEYNDKDVANVLDRMIAAIREKDEDRFIIYEVTGANDANAIIRESTTAYNTVSKKYNNTLISYNFCETTFAFYNLIDFDAQPGTNIDLVHHGIFVPEYPITIYAARQRLDNAHGLTMDGFLPAGTQINLYVKREGGGGKFTISAGSDVLYEEKLSKHDYNVSFPLSHFLYYATSEKKISFTLEKSVEKISFKCKDCYFEWSGMEVVLPEEYAVERYYSYSDEERAELGPDAGDGFVKRKTSTVFIGPNCYVEGEHITINEDVSYSSEAIYGQSNAETVDAWGAAINKFSPNAHIRLEDVGMRGVKEEDALKYYDTVLSMCDKYGIGWYCKEYAIMLGLKSSHAEETRVEYAGYNNFEIEKLKTLQKHR
ncbi:MAG: glycoside hydrolase family 5 protein [Lachnospiraceae bacterium]|nr:glycoside hydrolase family 5 protein [Lachnospiraceae bacterium]